MASDNPPLLPGLPDDIALLCLARVPSLSLLWRVSPSWQSVLSQSRYFHSLRSALGFKPQLWLYTLLHDDIPSQPAPDRCAEDRTDPSSAFSWHAYDPIANLWHRLPPFPHPVEFERTSPSFIGRLHSVQCASSHDKLFMVAGSRRGAADGATQRSVASNEDSGTADDRRPLEPALECPLIFDTQTCVWTQGAPFPVPRKWCACGTASGKLMVASGSGRDWDVSVSKSAEMYDPEDRKWVTLDDLKSSKFSGEAISVVNYGGKLHMVSGKGVFWKVGVIYDPKTGRWSDMPTGMRTGWNGQCVVADGKLLVLEDGSGRLKAYNQEEDAWTTLLREDSLKNMEQITNGGPGKLCGIVRAGHGSDRDVIQVVNISGTAGFSVLRPPLGQVVAVQVLSRIALSSDDASRLMSEDR